MKKLLERLFIGSSPIEKQKPVDPLGNHIGILQKVWDGKEYADYGLERIFRLFLITAKLLFPGIYLEHAFGKKNYGTWLIVAELYVIFKTLFPLALLYFGWTHQPVLLFLNVYFLLETFCFHLQQNLSFRTL